MVTSTPIIRNSIILPVVDNLIFKQPNHNISPNISITGKGILSSTLMKSTCIWNILVD